MGDRQTCSACGGRRLTEKTIYEIELDENGNQKPVARQIISPCTSCGGTGEIG